MTKRSFAEEEYIVFPYPYDAMNDGFRQGKWQNRPMVCFGCGCILRVGML